MSYRMYQIVDELRTIAKEAQSFAEHTKSNPDLTNDGKANTFANWGRQQKWDGRIDELTTRAARAAEVKAGEAARARATIFGTPSVNDQILAELRFARRGDSIRAALADKNNYVENIRQIIADAEPAELAILVEAIPTYFRESDRPDSHTAQTGIAAVEDALKARSPEYGKAADIAERTEIAAGVIERTASGARMAATDLNVSESALFPKLNGDVRRDAGDDVAELPA